MNSTTAAATTEVLRTTFTLYRLPEFAQFCHTNGIRYVRVLPYHSSSNSLAEHAVQMFKNGFKKMLEGIIQEKLSCFLFSCHITPQTTTGMSPAELLMGRTLRSHLHLLKPNLS